jgi:hypothetical protein
MATIVPFAGPRGTRSTEPTEREVSAAEKSIAESLDDKADGYYHEVARCALVAAREVAAPEGVTHDG